jgi:hypothetical protein
MPIVVLHQRHGMGHGSEKFAAEIRDKNDAAEVFRSPLPQNMRSNGQDRNGRLPKDSSATEPMTSFGRPVWPWVPNTRRSM